MKINLSELLRMKIAKKKPGKKRSRYVCWRGHATHVSREFGAVWECTGECMGLSYDLFGMDGWENEIVFEV